MRQKIIFFIFSLIIVFNCALSNAQKVIKIQVVNKSGLPVNDAVIKIENETYVGVSYSKTNANGNAIINLDSLSDLFLKITAPGFKSYRMPLLENHFEYKIILDSLMYILPEVKVKGRKGPHVISKGDSLFYSVKEFESRSDRTIGDILNKIPGIEIGSDGSISFKGKMIGSLYIDGDDLLGQKYGLATNNIQASMVDSIQVIDNDQHIKVLQGIEAGKSPSINLILNPKARTKWINFAEAKTGVPFEFEGKYSNIALKPSFKTLNVLSGNNSGKDLNDDFKNYIAREAKPWENVAEGGNVLNDSKISFSQLSTSRWLFNKGIMGSVNAMLKSKPDHFISINTGFLSQNDQESTSAKMTYFFPNDTIDISNSNTNRHSDFGFFAEIKSNANTKTKFLNNDFKINGNNNSNDGSIMNNNKMYSVHQNFVGLNLSNQFSSIQLVRHRLISEISSFILYDQEPEQMNITPGTLTNILNNNIPYMESLQNINYEKFYTSNSFGIRFSSDHFFQKYNIGFSFLTQSLGSELSLIDNNHNAQSAGSNYNDKSTFQNFTPFLYSEWNLDFGKNTITTSLLSSIPFFEYEDQLISKSLTETRLQLTPAFSYKTKIGKENKFSVTGHVTNTNNNIYSLYRGKILKDYRTVSSQSLPLDNTTETSIGTRFDFQKSLKIFFANVGARYSEVKNHWIYSTSISDESLVMEAIPFVNTRKRLSYFAHFSKYIFFISTNIEVSYEGLYSKGITFQNNETFPVSNYRNTIKGSVGKKMGKIAEVFYIVSFGKHSSIFSNKVNSNSNSFTESNNSLKVNITPNAKWLFNVNVMHHSLKQLTKNSFLFIDAKLRYTFQKPGIDINLGISNITGQKTLENLMYTENILSKTLINLRPRTFFVSSYFSF